jgi:hypothetical protein
MIDLFGIEEDLQFMSGVGFMLSLQSTMESRNPPLTAVNLWLVVFAGIGKK